MKIAQASGNSATGRGPPLCVPAITFPLSQPPEKFLVTPLVIWILILYRYLTILLVRLLIAHLTYQDYQLYLVA